MKSFFTALVAILFGSFPTCPVLAQAPATVPARTPAATDSTRQIRSAADTIPSTVRRNGVQVSTGLSGLTPDTLVVTAKQEAQIRKIIPRQATIRSLILPGMGQAYNRQYYKIPFIYAGFGVMGYLFVRYSSLAKEAETGYRRLLYGDKIAEAQYVTLTPGSVPALLTNSTKFYIPAQYIPVESVTIGIDPFSDRKNVFRSSANAKNAYDTFRRYRDLNLLLSTVLWAVNIIEANVAAHLKTFDLTDDITMRVEPNVIPMPGTGFVPGVRMAFTFK